MNASMEVYYVLEDYYNYGTWLTFRESISPHGAVREQGGGEEIRDDGSRKLSCPRYHFRSYTLEMAVRRVYEGPDDGVKRYIMATSACDKCGFSYEVDAVLRLGV